MISASLLRSLPRKTDTDFCKSLETIDQYAGVNHFTALIYGLLTEAWKKGSTEVEFDFRLQSPENNGLLDLTVSELERSGYQVEVLEKTPLDILDSTKYLRIRWSEALTLEAKEASAKKLRSIIPHLELAIGAAKIDWAPSTDVRLVVAIYQPNGSGQITASFTDLEGFLSDLKAVAEWKGVVAALEELEEDEREEEQSKSV